MLRPSLALFLAGAALALASTGCSVISGVHEAETEFLVKPSSTSKFNGWSEISIPDDPKSVDSAELLYVRLEARDTSVPDLTFIQTITAETKVGETFTKVAERTPMPRGERIVPLDLVYDGDLRDFFYEDGDDYTIHVTWRGLVDPSYPLPPEGVWMTVKIAVRIDD
ncbi:MAG: hypothetical protein IT372_35435 [Polyangiaceae bacterium]|nr:hypothetical protein [Polyangiaceae bacterium]